MAEHLLLKWGTLKGWELESEASRSAMKRYLEAGNVSAGAMSQHDNLAQKVAICNLIDAIDGKIQNDWTGETMTKDEAKKYVMGYGGGAAMAALVDAANK